jgi:hypothetical protein
MQEIEKFITGFKQFQSAAIRQVETAPTTSNADYFML